MLDRLRGKTRLLHYSKRTEDAYADWATKFILFHGKRHTQEMGTAEIAAYLTHLAVERKLAASTQNQAFVAILSRLPTPLLDRGDEYRSVGRVVRYVEVRTVLPRPYPRHPHTVQNASRTRFVETSWT